MEMSTMDTPIRKFIDSSCPNMTYDITAVNMVAMVLEYFLRIVSANL